jgi:hypothetical protein
VRTVPCSRRFSDATDLVCSLDKDPAVRQQHTHTQTSYVSPSRFWCHVAPVRFVRLFLRINVSYVRRHLFIITSRSPRRQGFFQHNKLLLVSPDFTVQRHSGDVICWAPFREQMFCTMETSTCYSSPAQTPMWTTCKKLLSRQDSLAVAISDTCHEHHVSTDQITMRRYKNAAIHHMMYRRPPGPLKSPHSEIFDWQSLSLAFSIFHTLSVCLSVCL